MVTLEEAKTEAYRVLRARVWHRTEITIGYEVLEALLGHASRCQECMRLDWTCEACAARRPNRRRADPHGVQARDRSQRHGDHEGAGLVSWTAAYRRGDVLEVQHMGAWERAIVLGHTSSGHLRVQLDCGPALTGVSKRDVRRPA